MLDLGESVYNAASFPIPYVTFLFTWVSEDSLVLVDLFTQIWQPSSRGSADKQDKKIL